MTGDIKTILLEKYLPMVEGAVDSVIEWGPDFFHRVVQFELVSQGVIAFFSLLLLVGWCYGIYRHVKYLMSDECDFGSGSEGIIVFHILIVFLIGFFIEATLNLLKVLIVPEIYLYAKYIAG